MLETTQAIVLRVHPFSETSHIVSWLTPGHGRIATVVKGALRPRSAFLGQYDLFYTCELVFYTRERGGVHIARECCPLKPRIALRRRWDSAAFASYACDLASRLTYAGACQSDLFGLLDSVLDAVTDESPRASLFFWYELQVLTAIGLAPPIGTDCCDCGRTLQPSGACVYVSSRNEVVCPACARSAGARAAGIPLNADLIAMLRAWRATSEPRQAQRVVCSGEQTLAFESLFDTLLASLADTVVVSRSLALDAVGARAKALGRI